MLTLFRVLLSRIRVKSRYLGLCSNTRGDRTERLSIKRLFSLVFSCRCLRTVNEFVNRTYELVRETKGTVMVLTLPRGQIVILRFARVSVSRGIPTPRLLRTGVVRNNQEPVVVYS